MNSAILISRSCTVGWFEDISYGELWLHPIGLVRQRLGVSHTLSVSGVASYHLMKGHVVDPSSPGTLPTVAADAFNLQAIANTSPKNRVIDFRHVAGVALRNGILFDRVNVYMTNGLRHKFLWIRTDNAYWMLRQELGRRLGPRFILS